MRICAIICEFNPFHNGHKYILERARKISDADAVLCIMSGSFTQRGEIGILDKYTRAKHAVLGGADAVIQLPAPFAVAPAEIFARGAVKILSSIPAVNSIAFGCENAETDFIKSAKTLIDENEDFKREFNKNIESGESFIKSYASAFYACGGDAEIMTKPNNVLGLEYAKAILRAKANIKLLPVKRVGSDFNDDKLADNFSSASAIRNNLKDSKVAANVPDFVFNDLTSAVQTTYEEFLRYALFASSPEDIKKVYGCSEGLENKLKSLENKSFGEIILNATSKRYSSARIKRILLANALKLYLNDCQDILKEPYIRVLAVRKNNADCILSEIAKSKLTVLTGNKFLNNKKPAPSAVKCIESDKREFKLYNFLNGKSDIDRLLLI